MAQYRIIRALLAQAKANKEKTLTSFELLTERAVGIGDHSTVDYIKNAEEALEQLAKAEEQIEVLKKYFPEGQTGDILKG